MNNLESNVEENSKKMLIALHEGRVPLFGGKVEGLNLTRKEISEAIKYIEQNNYWEIVGGTPKSGASHKITEKGLKYIGVEK